MRVSSYKKVPLKLSGQSYEHRSRAVSIQKTMNLIPQIEITGAADTSLTSWPGLISRYSASGADRGMTVFKGVLYKVTGGGLYRIDSDYSATFIGSIGGSARCIFAKDRDWETE